MNNYSFARKVASGFLKKTLFLLIAWLAGASLACAAENAASNSATITTATNAAQATTPAPASPFALDVLNGSNLAPEQTGSRPKDFTSVLSEQAHEASAVIIPDELPNTNSPNAIPASTAPEPGALPTPGAV